MKHTAVCPRCESQHVMRIARVADAADWVGSGGGPLEGRSGEQSVPRRVLQAKSTSSGVFGGKSESFRAAGEVEAYACADCGYFEEYLRDPRSIDWGSVVGATRHTAPRS